MPSEPDRSRARQLARVSLAQGDATGWFERLYKEAQQGIAVVPWADLHPNPNLLSWLAVTDDLRQHDSQNVLVVGCGLGDDAEHLATFGGRVTAFDIAPTAVQQARQRFPNSAVDYQTADLLNPPPHWSNHFDFVFEAYTLQALPQHLRVQAIENLAGFVKPSGALLLIARGREDTDPPGDMPWPLTLTELAPFGRLGLVTITEEDYLEGDTRRLRVLYRRL